MLYWCASFVHVPITVKGTGNSRGEATRGEPAARNDDALLQAGNPNANAGTSARVPRHLHTEPLCVRRTAWATSIIPLSRISVGSGDPLVRPKLYAGSLCGWERKLQAERGCYAWQRQQIAKPLRHLMLSVGHR
jgi:hypothetical protein